MGAGKWMKRDSVKDHLRSSQKHRENLVRFQQKEAAEAERRQRLQEIYSGNTSNFSDSFTAGPDIQHPGFSDTQDTGNLPFLKVPVEPFLNPHLPFDAEAERKNLERQVEKLLLDALLQEEQDGQEAETLTNVDEILEAHGGVYFF